MLRTGAIGPVGLGSKKFAGLASGQLPSMVHVAPACSASCEPCSSPYSSAPDALSCRRQPGRRPMRPLRAAGASGEAAPKKGAKRGSQKKTAGSAAAAAGAPEKGATAVLTPAVEEADAGISVDLEELEDAGQDGFLAPYMGSVVKVYCVHTEPNYSLPWQRKRQYTSTSTGFIIDGEKRWLLTNAHSCDYHTQVKVKKRGDDRKFLAKVLALGVDCDIALLTIEDDEFWAGAVPLQFGPLPRLQDSVAVVGYPIGGDTISVTVGVVSRIEVTEYSHGSTDLLGIQIDAAINGGNSGGPVFNRHGQCVGIAFQALSGSDVENVGYVIPTPVVDHFITDFQRTGGFSGFPALGIHWQRMESEALRRAFRMAPGQKGVLIRALNPTAFAAGVLKPDDVLMRFDGVDISCDGTVAFRTGERIAFSYLISNKFVGDTAQLRVLRDGKEMDLSVQLSRPAQLVPAHISNRDPSYLMVGGLVFTPCNEPYLASEYGQDYMTESPVKLLDKMYHTYPKTEGEQVVVLSQVLAAPATLGYEDSFNIQVTKFNGTPISNLRHLAEMVIACDTPFLRFDCDSNEVIVIERETAIASTLEAMEAHSIPHAMSADLRKALPQWVAPPGDAASA